MPRQLQTARMRPVRPTLPWSAHVLSGAEKRGIETWNKVCTRCFCKKCWAVPCRCGPEPPVVPPADPAVLPAKAKAKAKAAAPPPPLNQAAPPFLLAPAAFPPLPPPQDQAAPAVMFPPAPPQNQAAPAYPPLALPDGVIPPPPPVHQAAPPPAEPAIAARLPQESQADTAQFYQHDPPPLPVLHLAPPPPPPKSPPPELVAAGKVAPSPPPAKPQQASPWADMAGGPPAANQSAPPAANQGAGPWAAPGRPVGAAGVVPAVDAGVVPGVDARPPPVAPAGLDAPSPPPPPPKAPADAAQPTGGVTKPIEFPLFSGLAGPPSPAATGSMDGQGAWAARGLPITATTVGAKGVVPPLAPQAATVDPPIHAPAADTATETAAATPTATNLPLAEYLGNLPDNATNAPPPAADAHRDTMGAPLAQQDSGEEDVVKNAFWPGTGIIRVDIKAMMADIRELTARLVEVEGQLRSALERIDHLEGRSGEQHV